MKKSDWVSLASVRSVLTLIGELDELRADPVRRKKHMLDRLITIVGAAFAGAASTGASANQNGAISEVVTVGCSDADSARIVRAYSTRGAFANPIIPYLAEKVSHESAGVASTRMVMRDREWHASEIYNESIRPAQLDEHLLALRALPHRDGSEAFGFVRAAGDRHFSGAEVRLVEFFQEQLAAVELRRLPLSGTLSARQTDVFSELMLGKSEKEIADALQISPHTVHAHIKTIYRALGVRSRAELMAKYKHVVER